LELSPSDADAYDLLGRLCAALGRYDEALELHRHARLLDPLVHRLDELTTLLRAGRFVEAAAGAAAVVELTPDYDRARATLGWAYFLDGRTAEGIAELERAVELSPRTALWLGQLGEAYALAGQADRAREVLRRLDTLATEGYVSPYTYAYVYAGLGELDRAMDRLERAAADRTGPTYGVKGSFLLRPLHGHPRFEALLASMGLAR
jgi:tetratricopeptide (TPR) repeat protein